ncbi:hypothetical protein [Mesorhizobium sp.]|uniref:hypothetical protein n=1 Tax=Mesorhizobium sp. TaxID=1871066 RepID=UPI0025E19A87|nr:hypothetical protein [Mesorhizobium sp.]
MRLAIYIPPMPINPALICIVWHKRNTTDPTHRWLREVVLKLLSQLNASETDSSAMNPPDVSGGPMSVPARELKGKG